MQTPPTFPFTPPKMTAFDKAMDKLWQDFVQGVPIGGGMLFEKEVRSCTLDGSVDSLKQLDRLLLAIKKQLADKDEASLLQRAEFRTFLLFLASYTGRVLAINASTPVSWRSVDELGQLHRLDVSAGKFFTLAGLTAETLPPVFVLVAMGAKLFGSFARPFKDPITHTPAEESLYRLVVTCLEKMGKKTLSKEQLSNIAPQAEADKPLTAQATIAPTNPIAPTLATATPSVQTTPQAPINPLTSVASTAVANPIVANSTTSGTTISNTAVSNSPISNAPVSSSTTSAPPKPATFSSKKKTIVKKDELAEVKTDLTTLSAISTPHNDQYLKVKGVLEQVSASLKDGENFSQFTAEQTRAISQAIPFLQKVAEAGNTNAMLTLAIVHYDGIFKEADNTAVFNFTKRAAEMNDIRAMKLLSRLYYQGIGTNPSVEMGQLWLEKAATGGHPEAKKVQAQLSYISAMKQDAQLETQKDKKLYTVLGIAAVVLVLVLWLTAASLG